MAELGARIDCDVLVTGGGVAGASAAVAAARSGCRVTLIEKEKVLGGTGVLGMLRTVCGLYGTGDQYPAAPLNPGIAQEIAEALLAQSPQWTIRKMGKVFVLPCSAFELQRILAGLCAGEETLTVLTDATAVSVAAADGRVSRVTVYRFGGQFDISARAVVDCTGNGDVAFMAGAEFDCAEPEDLQLAGFTARLQGVREPTESLSLQVPFVLAEAVNAGRLSPSARFTTFALGDAPGEGFLKFSAFATDNGLSIADEAVRVLSCLAERLPALKNAAVAETSQGSFPREGRRIRGDYILTREDILAACKFPDGAVRSAWPIELWDQGKGPVYHYVPDGDYYEIPFRCLTVQGFSNLLVAGRCISVSHEALGSTRVMGTCMALGEQAGQAAAMLALSGEYPVFRQESP